MTDDQTYADETFGRHEILDRACSLMMEVDTQLLEHTCIRDDEKALAETAHKALFDLYQLVGRREHEEEEEPFRIVKKVLRWQLDPSKHPLTCGNDSSHLLLPWLDSGKVTLACPTCDYTQAHIPDVVMHD